MLSLPLLYNDTDRICGCNDTNPMTARYTNAEWAAIIAKTEKEIVVSQNAYECPEIGSPAFMKTIDHTLLKLEARSVQFDDLCAEARVDGFAVYSKIEKL